LNAEIVNRLKTSLEKQASGHRFQSRWNWLSVPELTDAERQLLGIFAYAPTKQLALISLFK